MKLVPYLLAVSSYAAIPGPVFNSLDATTASFNALTHDHPGNIYITGAATSSSFPATAGAYQTQYHEGACYTYSVRRPCGDAFVMKLDPKGQVLFATLIGGAGNDYATAIALDSEGLIYITGQTGHLVGKGNDFPITPDALFPHPAPDVDLGGTGYSWDAFFAIVSPKGDGLVYSTYLPGLSGQVLAIDRERSIYLAGTVNPQHSPIKPTPGTLQTKIGEGIGAMVIKLKPGGKELALATYLDGVGVASIAADSTGSVYLVGATAPGFPVTPGAFQTTFPSGQPFTGFVAKLNPHATALIYATYLGGTEGPNFAGACTIPYALKLASRGEVWVSGFTCASDFPVTPDALPPDNLNLGSMFVTRLDGNGAALVYSTLVPDSTSTTMSGMSLDEDAAGRVYFLSPSAPGFPVTPGAFEACRGRYTDLLAIEFTPTGQLQGASYLGGSGFGTLGPILAAGGGSVYIAGHTVGTDFPHLATTVSETVSFVLKLEIDNPKRISPPCS